MVHIMDMKDHLKYFTYITGHCYDNHIIYPHLITYFLLKLSKIGKTSYHIPGFSFHFAFGMLYVTRYPD